MNGSALAALAWRFTRSRTQVRSALPFLAAAGVLGLLLVSVNAFALSGSQVATRDLGSYDKAISDSLPFGDRLPPTYVTGLLNAAAAAGARDAATQISSFDVAPDALREQFNTGAHQTVSYVEQADLPGAFPGSYRLLGGRWPSRPGEVALSRQLADEIGDPDTISVFSGGAQLDVTGVVEPVYGQDSWRIIAAPGTWITLPERQIHRGFSSAGGTVRLYWNGAADGRAVADAISEVSIDGQRPAQMLTSYQTKDRTLREGADRPLTDRMPLVYTYPSLIIMALVALVVASVNRGRAAAILERLHATGLRRLPVRAALVSSMVVATILAAIVGSLIGYLLGLVGRVTVLPAVISQPLSPTPSPFAPASRILLIAVVTVAGASWISLTSSPRLAAHLGRLRTAAPWAALRRVIGIVAVIRALPTVASASDLDTLGSGTAWMLTGILLLAPDLLRVATLGLTTSRTVPLMARRLIEHDRARYAIAVTSLAACVGLPTAVATFIATETRTEAAKNVSQVPDHQIIVDVGNSNPKTANDVQRLISSTPGVATDPVEVRSIYSTSESIRFQHDGVHGAFGIWVVHDAEALNRMLDGHLSAEAKQALEVGGVVDWSGAQGPQRISIVPNQGQARSTDELPTADIDTNDSYEYAAAGAILAKTAHDLGLSSRISHYIFTNLDDDAIRQAVKAVTSAGYDPRSVAYHLTPPPTRPTNEWYAGGGGTTLAGFIVLWLVLASQARQLRNYAGRLLAIGLRSRWPAAVMLTQTAITLGLGLVVGVAAGAVPIALFATTAIHGLVLDIPWRFIVVTAGAGVLAALTASLTALRSLRPRQLDS